MQNENEPLPVSTVFLDIGGVLLTNGWDHVNRHKAAEVFGLDERELNERHSLIFNTYEEGKVSLDDYLDRVVFYQDRPFTRDRFKDFMFEQSRPDQKMIDLFLELKSRYKVRMAALNNEGRELNEFRIQKFSLGRLFDFFISSCFIHVRKPDPEIYRHALDIAQVHPGQAVYLDDRLLCVEVARGMGMNAIHHTEYDRTRAALQHLGLNIGDEPRKFMRRAG